MHSPLVVQGRVPAGRHLLPRVFQMPGLVARGVRSCKYEDPQHINGGL